MSEFTFRGKAPQPIEYSSQKLMIRQGAPGNQRPSGNASQKVEFRGQTQTHTMGRKSYQLTSAPSPSTQGKPNKPAAPVAKGKQAPDKAHGSIANGPKAAQASTEFAEVDTTPPTAPIFSPGSAMLIGQLLEGFIFNELLGPRAQSPMTYIAKEALVAIQPLLPTGVSIPVPVITPEMAAQYGIGPAVAPQAAAPPSDAAVGQQPTVTIVPLAASAPVAHEIRTGVDGFTCSCGQTFNFPMGSTAEQIDAAARAASVHSQTTTPSA